MIISLATLKQTFLPHWIVQPSAIMRALNLKSNYSRPLSWTQNAFSVGHLLSLTLRRKKNEPHALKVP
jgi:hypothetical protein